MAIRYGVVGLGHIAQTAVLPAFKHAKKNSKLVALVSGTPSKLKKVSKKYKVDHIFSYEEFEQLLDSGLVDALYICLPNHLHQDYATRALKRGVHVLCEKPLALTSNDCHEMIKASTEGKAKFMTAYRLHFEASNLKAIEIANSGKIGELRYFDSVFSYQLQDSNNIRAKKKAGGGPIWDIGTYCINAARYIFKSEPLEVMAMKASDGSKRFKEVEEMASAILKFPKNRVATFTCSFGAHESAEYKVFGTKGSLTLEKAYDYSTPRKLKLNTEKDGKETFKYKKCNQFAPEIVYFSNCILKNKSIEPSGFEGLADVLVIEALYESSRTGKAVSVKDRSEFEMKRRPKLKQRMYRKPNKKPNTVAVISPSRD